ncbi:uncharacterized protein [Pocillopora verrucosa]|uniref:uncharacterized protein isoform X2 n=1 Tax=Pocillopora verrucosa TaxID=203993 RepID=UPI00333F5BD7
MFCSHCGIGDAQESICDNCVAEKDVNEVIKRYFHRGYPYDAIVGLLKKREGLQMCVRTLKRRLRCLGLKRKGNAKIMDDSEIRNIIREEMEGPGSLSGYDKLKPYGFPIHGAVDGFSRRILWLEVTRSNNDPKVVAAFYLKQVKELGGCPLLLVTDYGSENGIAASIQCMFRTNDQDELAGVKSHRYCSSPANQRIEGWWSFFRRNRSNWWISLFKDMVDYGLLCVGNTLQMECLWFCFSKLLQDDLDKVKDHWNSHNISKSPYSSVHGVPDVMYFLPKYHRHEECLVSVPEQLVEDMDVHCQSEREDNIYLKYFEYILETKGWVYPSTPREAIRLYQHITELQND